MSKNCFKLVKFCYCYFIPAHFDVKIGQVNAGWKRAA